MKIVRAFALFLSCSSLPFACGPAVAESPQDTDDAYSVNRTLAAADGRSVEVADANETLRIKLAMAQLLWPVDLGVLKAPAEDAKFRDQIKALQSQMQAPATGDLTFGQATMLEETAQLLSERRVYGSGSAKVTFDISEDKNLVMLSGSLSMEDLAFPINSTRIACWKSDGTCIVATAYLDFHDTGYAGSPRLLDVTVEEFDITALSDANIIAVTENLCGGATLAIDIRTGTAKIVGVPDLVSESCQELHSSMTKAQREKIHVATLIDSSDASAKFFDARRAQGERLIYKPNLEIYDTAK